jgi:HAE1 family hydrophobic/amphiphilic exporter-1
MTAFAFILGCIPLWIATGAGAISRQVLGTVVIGGMLASTLIAIFIVPVTFAVVEQITHRVATRGARKETREPVISGDGL